MKDERGLVVAAAEVDHITPRYGSVELLADWNNLQALCSPCHAVKTAREDGSSQGGSGAGAGGSGCSDGSGDGGGSGGGHDNGGKGRGKGSH
jgi:hypothetical protein